MNDEKVMLSETEKLISEQIKYGSYIRALTDDFSVIDRVLKEDENNG